MSDEAAVGPWVVVISGAMRYIGRIDVSGPFFEELKIDNPRHRVPLLLDTHHRWARLIPAYELHAPFVRDPETGRMRREALITHPDFVLQNKVAPLHVFVDAYYFLEDLAEDDRAVYMRLVAKADEAIAEALKKARGRTSHA